MVFEDINSVVDCLAEWNSVLPEALNVCTGCIVVLIIFVQVTAMGNVPSERIDKTGTGTDDQWQRPVSPPLLSENIPSDPQRPQFVDKVHSVLLDDSPPHSEIDGKNNRGDDIDSAAVRRYDAPSPAVGERERKPGVMDNEMSSIMKEHSGMNTSVVVQDFSSVDSVSERLSLSARSRDDIDTERTSPEVDYTQSALQREAARLRKLREDELEASKASPGKAESLGTLDLSENGVDEDVLSPHKGGVHVLSPKQNDEDAALGESTGSLWRVASKRATVTAQDSPLAMDDVDSSNPGNTSPTDKESTASPPARTVRKLSSKVIRVQSGEYPVVDHMKAVSHREEREEEGSEMYSPGPTWGAREDDFAGGHLASHVKSDPDRTVSTDSNSSVIVVGNDATLQQHDDEGSVSRIEDLSDHNGATPFRRRGEGNKMPSQIPSFVGDNSTISPNSHVDTAASKPQRHSGFSSHNARGESAKKETKGSSPRRFSADDSPGKPGHGPSRRNVDDSRKGPEAYQKGPTQRESDALMKISDEQKYRLMSAVYPELTHPYPHPAVSGMYPEGIPATANHPHEYVHFTGANVSSGVQPGQGMEHLLHRMRLLEAESRARREQQAEDEKRLARCETEWVSEITALRVQLSDVELRLDEERKKNRKLMSDLAAKESEIQTLRGMYCVVDGSDAPLCMQYYRLIVCCAEATNGAMEQRMDNAKALAEREALSTGKPPVSN